MATIFAHLSSLLSVSDLTELLNTNTPTIHRLNSGYQIPAPLRIGSRPRWRQEEIEPWLKASCPNRDENPSINDKRRRRKNLRQLAALKE